MWCVWRKESRMDILPQTRSRMTSYTLVTISQYRGVESEPLTMARVIVPDDPNYQLDSSIAIIST